MGWANRIDQLPPDWYIAESLRRIIASRYEDDATLIILWRAYMESAPTEPNPEDTGQ